MLQYHPTPAPPNPTAAAPAPAAGAKKATGAKDAAKQLTAAQQRAKAEDAKWKAIDVNALESDALSFGRPDFSPYKPGGAPDGFVADRSFDEGGPRPGHKFTPDTHPAHYVARKS